MKYIPIDLEKNEIRLLTILPRSPGSAYNVQSESSPFPGPTPTTSDPTPDPSAGSDTLTNDTIQCTLEHFSLNEWTAEYLRHVSELEAPATRLKILSSWIHSRTSTQLVYRFTWGDYVALSYTWKLGDWEEAEKPCRILLNEYTVHITRNLEAALRVLREEAETRLGLKLWVDAICINQDDILERGEQVKRMSDVYLRAWNVMAFLGPNDDSKAIDFITTMTREYRDRTRDFCFLLRDWTSSSMHKTYKRIWIAIANLFERPYWRRLWIVQELAMGGESTAVLSGNHRLLARDFFLFARLLAAAYPLAMPTFAHELGFHGSEALIQNIARVCQIHALSQTLTPGSRPRRLDMFVQVAHHSREADSRDKVYGLLSLLDPAVTSLIRPDYQSPTLDVYIDFSKAMIQATGKLTVLFTGNHEDLPETWPSWVLDWRLDPGRDTWRFEPGYYQSGGDGRAEVRFLPNRLLMCRGFEFDQIVATTQSGFFTGDTVASESISSEQSGHRYIDDEGLKDALRRAFLSEPPSELQSTYLPKRSVFDIPWDIDEPPNENVEHGWTDLRRTTHYQKFEDFRQMNRDFNVFGHPFKSFFKQSVTHPCGEPGDLIFSMRSFTLALTGRRLMRTAKGYVGVCVKGARPETPSSFYMDVIVRSFSAHRENVTRSLGSVL